MSGKNPPERWVDAPKGRDAARAGLLLAQVETPEAPAGAKARVYRTLELERKAPRRAPLYAWGLAGALAGAGVVALIVLAPWPNAERPAPRAAVLAELSGAVLSGVPSREAPAAVGAELAQGSRLKTGEDGRATLALGSLARLDLGAEGLLTLSNFHRGAAVELEHGTLMVTVQPTPASRLTLIAGRWSLDTDSAVLEVSHPSADSLAVAVQRGAVRLSSQGASQMLGAGQSYSSVGPAARAEAAPAAAAEEQRGPSERLATRVSRSLKSPAQEPRAVEARPSPVEPEPTPPIPAPEDARDPAVLYARARAERDPTRAIPLFDRVASMGGAFAEISAHQAARLSMRIGRCSDAIERYSALLAAEPRGPYAQEARLDVLECRLKLGELEAARHDLEAFPRMHPDSERLPELSFLRAELLRLGGRCREALTAYTSALSTTRGEDAEYFRAWCENEIGERVAARAALGLYLQHYPEGRHITDARALIKTLER